MSDMSDLFKDVKEAVKLSKVQQKESAAVFLKSNGIQWEEHNEGLHYVIQERGGVDFWPSTGKWRSRNGQHKGEDVEGLCAWLRPAGH